MNTKIKNNNITKKGYNKELFLKCNSKKSLGAQYAKGTLHKNNPTNINLLLIEYQSCLFSFLMFFN